MRLAGPLVLGASLLNACAVGPNFKAPPAPTPASFLPPDKALPQATASAPVGGGEAQRFVTGRDIPGEWWTLFQSAELNALVEAALKNNPTLESAQAALRQANENLAARAARSIRASAAPIRRSVPPSLSRRSAYRRNGSLLYI